MRRSPASRAPPSKACFRAPRRRSATATRHAPGGSPLPGGPPRPRPSRRAPRRPRNAPAPRPAPPPPARARPRRTSRSGGCAAPVPTRRTGSPRSPPPSRRAPSCADRLPLLGAELPGRPIDQDLAALGLVDPDQVEARQLEDRQEGGDRLGPAGAPAQVGQQIERPAGVEGPEQAVEL